MSTRIQNNFEWEFMKAFAAERQINHMSIVYVDLHVEYIEYCYLDGDKQITVKEPK
jgi:hypothetical protein